MAASVILRAVRRLGTASAEIWHRTARASTPNSSLSSEIAARLGSPVHDIGAMVAACLAAHHQVVGALAIAVLRRPGRPTGAARTARGRRRLVGLVGAWAAARASVSGGGERGGNRHGHRRPGRGDRRLRARRLRAAGREVVAMHPALAAGGRDTMPHPGPLGDGDALSGPQPHHDPSLRRGFGTQPDALAGPQGALGSQRPLRPPDRARGDDRSRSGRGAGCRRADDSRLGVATAATASSPTYLPDAVLTPSLVPVVSPHAPSVAARAAQATHPTIRFLRDGTIGSSILEAPSVRSACRARNDPVEPCAARGR